MINFIITLGLMILSLIICFVLMFGIPIWLLVWIYRGFKQGGDIQKKKKLTTLQIKLSTLLIIVYFPLAYINGAFGAATGRNEMFLFCLGFIFVEAIPILCLLLSLFKSVKQRFSKQGVIKTD